MSDTLIEARGCRPATARWPCSTTSTSRSTRERSWLSRRNGAGKTTTLLTLAGELPPLDGDVRFLGEVTTAPMHARCRKGLGYVTEERSVIMSMSVADNLKLADVEPGVGRDLPGARNMLTAAPGSFGRRAADALPGPGPQSPPEGSPRRRAVARAGAADRQQTPRDAPAARRSRGRCPPRRAAVRQALGSRTAST